MRNRRARGATAADCVGGRDRDEESAVAYQQAEARGVVRQQPPGHGDERARAPAGRRDEQAIGAVRFDDRELVHDVREVTPAGRADGRARTPRDLEGPPGVVWAMPRSVISPNSIAFLP